jgi:predicted RNA-binding Zn ribbon-like protein
VNEEPSFLWGFTTTVVTVITSYVASLIGFAFDAGAPCLELLLSGGEGARARYEVLHEPADLVTWLAAGSLDVAGHGVAPGDVGVTTADLSAARRLREAIWSAAMGAATGGGPGPAALAVVNELAAAPGVTPQVDPSTARLVWRPPVTAAQLVAELARDAVATFSAPTVDRVRKCANPRCALLYLDTSRPGRRRWCSMRRCGNRNKILEYRQRRLEH